MTVHSMRCASEHLAGQGELIYGCRHPRFTCPKGDWEVTMNKCVTTIAVLLLGTAVGCAADAKPQRHGKSYIHRAQSYSPRPTRGGEWSSHESSGATFGSARWWEGKGQG